LTAERDATPVIMITGRTEPTSRRNVAAGYVASATRSELDRNTVRDGVRKAGASERAPPATKW
jgi:hypothetical protein